MQQAAWSTSKKRQGSAERALSWACLNHCLDWGSPARLGGSAAIEEVSDDLRTLKRNPAVTQADLSVTCAAHPGQIFTA